jgi:hypothetical protein
MSAKAQFLQKLQDQLPRTAAFDTKAEADITAFRQRISLLHESMETWLTGTEVRTETTNTSLIEFLIGGSAFSVPGIILHYQQRSIRFTPIYLYGQDVTGCIEVCLCTTGNIQPLYRLFMRRGGCDDWTWSPAGTLNAKQEAFFTMIAPLLPE